MVAAKPSLITPKGYTMPKYEEKYIEKQKKKGYRKRCVQIHDDDREALLAFAAKLRAKRKKK
jgi:hypothetical protein